MDIKGGSQTQSGSELRWIPTTEKCLVLTFDDAPDTEYTPAVLDILAQYGVPATFFCIGEQVERNPEVLKSIVKAGHIVGNHSWNHPHLTTLSPDEVVIQLERTSEIICQIVGRRPHFFRPPYGDINISVARQVHGMGYQVVLWDVDSVDWSGIPGPTIAANVLPRLRAGSILLHHSAGNVRGTVHALPYILEVAQAMGYRFVPLDQLTGISAYMETDVD